MKKISSFILFLLIATAASAQTVQLTTYYPAPFGVFDRILFEPRDPLGTPCAIGTIFVEDVTVPDNWGRIWYCDENHVAAPTVGVYRLGINAWTLSNDLTSLYVRDYDNTSLQVGIGTSAPDSIFHILNDTDPSIHIESDTDAWIELEADTNDGIGENDNPYILLTQDGGTTSSVIGLVGNAGSNPSGGLYINTLADALLIGTITSNAVHLGTSATTRVTITSDGKVGIGTNTVPAAATVEIASPGLTTLFIDSSGGRGSGGRIIMRDTGGPNCTEITFSIGGVQNAVVACP